MTLSVVLLTSLGSTVIIYPAIIHGAKQMQLCLRKEAEVSSYFQLNQDDLMGQGDNCVDIHGDLKWLGKPVLM